MIFKKNKNAGIVFKVYLNYLKDKNIIEKQSIYRLNKNFFIKSGVFSVLDFKDNLKEKFVPQSCCHESDKDAKGSCVSGSEYRDGCVQTFRKFTYNYKIKSIIFILISQFWQSLFYYWV